MILWVFKNLLSLIVLGVFATLVFAKTASHDEEDVLDDVGGGLGGFGGGGFGEEEEIEEEEDGEDDSNKVYPPHMWKGMVFWVIIVYGLVNLVMISRFFR